MKQLQCFNLRLHQKQIQIGALQRKQLQALLDFKKFIGKNLIIHLS